MRPEEEKLFSQVQTSCFRRTSDLSLGFLSSDLPTTSDCHSPIPHPYPFASISQQCVTTPSGEREGGGSHPKIPEVKCAHEERPRCRIPLCGCTPGGAVFQSSRSCRIAGCSQSGKMPLIGLTDMVLGTESHCPHLKAGFTKHTSAGDIGQMSAPRTRGRGREVPCLARGGRGTSTPHPANLASLCAGLTRGSW